ncbi:MAG: hypothetical protein GY950_00655 [bacterium]|nr:hypothetical protein [bacterium]
MRRVKKVFLILLAYLLLFPGSLLNSREQELSYEVSVSVIRVPFVAVDKKGTPVFDLKKDDLALYVNGQPVPIHSLQRMVLTSASPKEQQAQHIKPPPK